MLAANTNVDALSSFTACISAIPLRLNAGFIDIYELFSGNVFIFFQICAYLFGVLLFVERALFFAKPEFPQPLNGRGGMPTENFRNFFEVGIRVRLDIFAIKPIRKLPVRNRFSWNAIP